LKGLALNLHIFLHIAFVSRVILTTSSHYVPVQH